MKFSMLVSAMAALLAAGSAQAAELEPSAGKSIKLGTVTGTAYYMVGVDGYEVVATVASGEDQTPVRFVTTLLDGQRTILSVPGEVGQSAQMIEFKRIETRVFVSDGAKISIAE